MCNTRLCCFVFFEWLKLAFSHPLHLRTETDPFPESGFSLQYRTMDRAEEPSKPDINKPPTKLGYLGQESLIMQCMAGLRFSAWADTFLWVLATSFSPALRLTSPPVYWVLAKKSSRGTKLTIQTNAKVTYVCSLAVSPPCSFLP